MNDDARTSGPPLDHDAAAKLDEQIQDTANKAGEHLDYLADLLAEARQGRSTVLQFDKLDCVPSRSPKADREGAGCRRPPYLDIPAVRGWRECAGHRGSGRHV